MEMVHERLTSGRDPFTGRQQPEPPPPEHSIAQNGQTSQNGVPNGTLSNFDPMKIVENSTALTNRSKSENSNTLDLDESAVSQPPAPLPTTNHQNESQSPAQNGDVEMKRLNRYEVDLKKRVEKQQQENRQQEFLRSSIRTSKRLKALEKENSTPKQPNGAAVTAFDNEAYEAQVHSIELNEVLDAAQRVTTTLEQYPELQQDAHMIQSLFAQPTVQSAIGVTATVHESWTRAGDHVPSQPAARDAVDGVIAQLGEAISDSAADLQNILENPHLAAVSHAHDELVDYLHGDVFASTSRADSDALLGLKETPMTGGPLEFQGNLRIIRLFKPDDSYLGATVRSVDGDGRIVIGRIVRGGVAHKAGLLHEGDEILEVQGHDLRGKTVNQVCDLLRNMSGEITFVTLPYQPSESGISSEIKSSRTGDQPVRHMRALFDYDPEDDLYVPCKELALKFQKGDVLHVISMDDENWWQAYRDGDDPSCSLAGLIPSAAFQTQRELYARELMNDQPPSTATAAANGRTKKGGTEASSDGSSLLCAKRTRKSAKTKSSSSPTTTTSQFGAGTKLLIDDLSSTNDAPEVLTYEEVSLYLARTGRRRPIVLVGATNVGCLQLRQKLIESDATKYSGVVPYTTRQRRTGEQDGVHYHFISKQKFNDDAKRGQFVEWGEFEKYCYGTTFESIRKIVANGKTCVLTMKPQALKSLRATNLMPFVIFVAPPSLQQLRAQRQKAGQHQVKDDELKTLINEAKRQEADFGHLFDRILVNIDLERTFRDLAAVIDALETEPQWVPSSWLKTGTDTLTTSQTSS